MDWKEKITMGMELIRQGCEDGGDGEFKDCPHCPFDSFCTILNREYYPMTVEDLFCQNTNNN